MSDAAEGPAPSAEAWIAAFARALGLPEPDDRTRAALLRVASVAAHASERRAAPIATWLAGVAGLSPEEALAAAERVARPPSPDPPAR